MLGWLKEKFEDFLIGKPRRKRKKASKRRKPVRVKRVTRKKKTAKQSPRKKAAKKKATIKKKTSEKKVVKKKALKKKVVRKKVIRKKILKKKVVKKSIVKKAVKKPAKKKAPKKPAKKKIVKKVKQAPSKGIKVGTVEHVFSKIQVVVFKVENPFKVGDSLVAWHKDTKIGKQKIKSMQINRIPIDEARRGEEIGLQLKIPIKAGDDLYLP